MIGTVSEGTDREKENIYKHKFITSSIHLNLLLMLLYFNKNCYSM